MNKQITFDEFLLDKCTSHTNNGPEGYEKWLEELDTQQVMDYADEYGELVHQQILKVVTEAYQNILSALQDPKE